MRYCLVYYLNVYRYLDTEQRMKKVFDLWFFFKKNSEFNKENLHNPFSYIISTSKPPTLVGGMHYGYILRTGEAMLMHGSMIPPWNITRTLLLLQIRDGDDSGSTNTALLDWEHFRLMHLSLKEFSTMPPT